MRGEGDEGGRRARREKVVGGEDANGGKRTLESKGILAATSRANH